MKSTTDIKAIIFDYGGTIDSDAEHWSEIIWRGYLHAGVDVHKYDFLDAYVSAERYLAANLPMLKEMNFLQLMCDKVASQLRFLSQSGCVIDDIDAVVADVARFCYDSAKQSVERNRGVLETLMTRYDLAVVSNFYGNLRMVLADFGILRYFKVVIDSGEVGVRKPDTAIFEMALDALGHAPDEVLVVGDSYKNDIAPALVLGCNATWLKGTGWAEESGCEEYAQIIRNLQNLLLSH